jgi:glutaredoxin 3
MKPVQVYTTSYCGYCRRAKELLSARGVAFQEIDVTGDDAAREELVRISGGLRTVPQIFIGELHVGGYTDLAALQTAGKLDELLT